MAGLDRSDDSQDSLERIERRLAMEEALIEKIGADERLSLEAREHLIREILTSDEFWNDDDRNDDDALAILVRKLGPKGPMGKSGIAVRPELESDGILEDDHPKFHTTGPHDSLGDTERA